MIQHYVGYQDSRRVYAYHKIPFERLEELQVNASKTMQVRKPDLNLVSRNKWTDGDLNPRPPECKSGVHTN
jgi:hypothetical protein